MGMFSWLFGKKKKRKKRRPAAGKRPQGAQPAAAAPVAEPPKVEPPPEGYFEVPLPDGDGVCSDDECMCGGDVIARGTGYLYVDQDTVDFRSNAPSVEEARAKEGRVRSQMGDMDEAAAVMHGRTTALLICEQSARRRDIDLKVAAADAGHWWETGQAPLRATPEAKPVEAATVADKPAEKKAKPKAKKKAKPKVKKTEPKAKKSTKSKGKKKKEEGEGETQG